MSIDRESIANEIFLGGDLHVAARNILTGIPWLESPNTSIEFDIEAANDLLDTGWLGERRRLADQGRDRAGGFLLHLGHWPKCRAHTVPGRIAERRQGGLGGDRNQGRARTALRRRLFHHHSGK